MSRFSPRQAYSRLETDSEYCSRTGIDPQLQFVADSVTRTAETISHDDLMRCKKHPKYARDSKAMDVLSEATLDLYLRSQSLPTVDLTKLQSAANLWNAAFLVSVDSAVQRRIIWIYP